MVTIQPCVGEVNVCLDAEATPDPVQAALDALDAVSAKALRVRAQIEALVARQAAEPVAGGGGRDRDN